MVGPRRQRHGAGVALLCAVLALGPWGADARRKLHQSDESGETGDAAGFIASIIALLVMRHYCGPQREG